MSNLPRFKAPEPIEGEWLPTWHQRVIAEFERFVNEDLVPAISQPVIVAEQAPKRGHFRK